MANSACPVSGFNDLTNGYSLQRRQFLILAARQVKWREKINLKTEEEKLAHSTVLQTAK